MKMHIGKNVEECPDIFINTWKVKSANQISAASYEFSDELGDTYKILNTKNHKYLGDILSSDTKNMKNILERKRKGISIISHIKHILDEGYLGPHYFKAAIMLRESLFLNSILLNVEVLVNVTQSEVKHLV